MKKTLAFILTFLLIFQVSLTTLAFVDTTNNIFTGKKYTHDDRFAGREIVYGLDISVHQGTISDFNKVKAAGVDFMFLRAAYRGYGSAGSLNKDTMFAGYASGALAAGIDIGSYIYSQAITVAEAEAEADYILNIVKSYDITLPIVFDYEYISGGRLSNANLTNRQRTDICLAFCKKVEQAGYTACVYANHSMFKNDIYTEELDDYVLWLAQYNTKPELGGTFFQPDYEYWQYSSSGSVNGINTRVDCNFRYFKAPDKVTGLSLSGTTLTWNKVKGCYGYEIYRYSDISKTYAKISTNIGASSCTFTDTSTNGVSCSYKVKAISRNKGAFVGGEFSDDVGEILTQPSTNQPSTTQPSTTQPSTTQPSTTQPSATQNGESTSSSTTQPNTQPEHIHSYTAKLLEQATCVKKGMMAYVCSCGDMYTKDIDKTVHEIELDEGYESTCTNTGLTQGSHCSTCGEVIIPQKIIEKREHVFVTETENATYFKNGLTKKVCASCGYVSENVVEKKLTLKIPNVKLKNGKKQFKVTYKKVTGATGFQVRYKLKGKWVVKTFNTTKTTTKVIKKLKKGVYKVEVRAIVKSKNKKAYSKWSKTKKANVK